MQAIGYKEQFLAAADGHGHGAARPWSRKLRSRQYAKRQLTWFRRGPVHPMDLRRTSEWPDFPALDGL